jgi:two-component system sensor histidine kinase RegB
VKSPSASDPSLNAEIPAWYVGASRLAAVPWLVRLRWSTVALEAIVLAVAVLLPRVDLPLRQVAPLVALSAGSSVAIAIWLSRGRSVPSALAALGLAADVALLTGLLELTGGPFNPFSVIFLVQIALAALTLGQMYAVGVGGCAVAGYLLLVYWHTTELDPLHHRLTDFPTHLFTMWVAVATTAELAAYFVVQASNALARREGEIEAMRAQAARNERLVALTTLAAGAAHELSTPLATIALASRELERAASAAGSSTGLAEDARLIRAEVDRCRAILDQMSGRAGGVAPDSPAPLDLAAVMEEVRSRLPADCAHRLEVRIPPSIGSLELPRAGLAQALLSLVKNAFDATWDHAHVVVDVARDRERLRLTVRDQGRGMAPEVLMRAGEPFFTTKEPGRGLGLGLFLVRVFAERLGGSLVVQSNDGTTATIELPLAHADDQSGSGETADAARPSGGTLRRV